MRVFVPYMLILALLTACQPDGPMSDEQRRIADIKKIAGNGKYEQEYVQIGNGERMFEQTQWTKIEDLDSVKGYHHLEVYNVYKDEKGRVEYYISEFDIVLEDTSRQLITDYQAIVEPDTVFTLLGVENNFKFDQVYEYEVGKDNYEVFKLFGYAHAYDKNPVHVKYWSPVFGTILIYSGQNESFELETFQGDREVVAGLLKQIKEEMGKKKM